MSGDRIRGRTRETPKSGPHRNPQPLPVGLEAQSFSPWLFKELTAVGLPAIVVEAVHMQKALSAQRNKTDRNDARGIAHMMRVGWFRQVHVKDDDNQRLRVLLSGRRLLKRKLVDIENELRGSLKAFGIKIGADSRANSKPTL